MRRNPAEALIQLFFVRLACVKHAASVRPEPESNSQVYGYIPKPFGLANILTKLNLILT